MLLDARDAYRPPLLQFLPEEIPEERFSSQKAENRDLCRPELDRLYDELFSRHDVLRRPGDSRDCLRILQSRPGDDADYPAILRQKLLFPDLSHSSDDRCCGRLREDALRSG